MTNDSPQQTGAGLAAATGSPARHAKLILWLRGNVVVFFLGWGILKTCQAREIEKADGWRSLPHYLIAYVILMFAIYFLRKQENADSSDPR